MAKVKLSEPFESMSGGYNKKYFCSTRGTKTVLCKRGKKADGKSEKQLIQQRLFTDAGKYAAAAKGDPEIWAWYESLKDPDHSAFNMAVADFLTCPVIQKLDTSSYTGSDNEIILVIAFDKFRVTGVTVSITAPDGTLIEEGPALRRAKTCEYSYLTTVENRQMNGTVITAVATDTPGHRVELSKTLLTE